jgi:CRISPR-associated protein Cas2
VSNLLEGYGRRVQESVFECFISLEEMERLYERVRGKVKAKEDSVRLYWVPVDALARTLTIGSLGPDSPPKCYII